MPSPRRPRVRYPNKMGVRIVCEARSHEPRVVQLGRINKLPPDAHPSSALGTVATTGGWGNSRGTREELIGDTPVERTGLAADHSNAADVLAESERITQHGRQRITFRCGFCGDCVGLRERVETMQRAEAERLAGTQLSKPAALWAAGTELTAVLDDKGNVDPAKVAAAAETAATVLGAAAPMRRPLPDSAQGASGGTSRANPWKEAFGRDKA